MSHTHPFGIGHDGLDGANGEIDNVIEGNQGPQTGQDAPVVQSEHRKEQCRAQDNAHGTPAVKGMEQAHHPLLVGERTGLDDGTAKHLDEAATHGIDRDA